MFTLFAFYKYVPVPNPQLVCEAIYHRFLMLGITGKLYVAAEGINGNFTATPEVAEAGKQFLNSFPGFEDIWFKEEQTDERAYKKLAVRVKKELVHSGVAVTPGEGAERLTPEMLNKMYADGQKFVIIDTRNSYESEIGHFKNALLPAMTNFREWPAIVESLKEYADTPVVTYCTGGIRCEKAAAYMAGKGFKKVYQLDGGILTYIKQFPDANWLGGMFVFDERKVVEPNSKEELKHTAQCRHCSAPTSNYENCYNLDCDKIFSCCPECAETHNHRCSEECKSAVRVRTGRKQF